MRIDNSNNGDDGNGNEDAYYSNNDSEGSYRFYYYYSNDKDEDSDSYDYNTSNNAARGALPTVLVRLLHQAIQRAEPVPTCTHLHYCDLDNDGSWNNHEDIIISSTVVDSLVA